MFYKALMLAAMAVFSGNTALSQQPAVSSDALVGYRIGPGDVLSVKALGEKDFEIESITVDEDGKIILPYDKEGPIMAKCLTERELLSEVAKRWSVYLKNPQLYLRVTQRNSRPPVSVYGEVRQQQQLILTRRVRLLEVISAAGGITEKSGGTVQVFRTRPPMCADAAMEAEWKTETADGFDTPSRLYSIVSLRQGREEANPEILPGDIIVVAKAAPVYVVGEVIKPGELDLPEGGLPLTQAVAMASGFSREAKTKSVKVYRRKQGVAQPEIIVANFEMIKKGQEKDIMLEPFDIVEVGKSKKSFGDILMETITGLPSRIPIRPI